MATAEAEASRDERSPPGGLVYDGFISYSHAADDLLAPRLQAGLQRFAKPWWKRVAAKNAVARPAVPPPRTTACADCAASITASYSSLNDSHGGRPSLGIGSEAPTPRRSNRMSRAKRPNCSKNARECGSSHSASNGESHPVLRTKSTGGGVRYELVLVG